MPGLVILAAAAAVYDAYAVVTRRETISAGVRRLRRSQSGRMAAGAAVAALIVHLLEES